MSVAIELPRTNAAKVSIVLPRNRGDVFMVNNSDRDNLGQVVPTWLPQTFTYDPNGNLQTTTVVQGSKSWVRTLTYDGGVQTGDSGWVRQ